MLDLERGTVAVPLRPRVLARLFRFADTTGRDPAQIVAAAVDAYLQGTTSDVTEQPPRAVVDLATRARRASERNVSRGE